MNESSEKPTCLPYVQPLDKILCFTGILPLFYPRNPRDPEKSGILSPSAISFCHPFFPARSFWLQLLRSRPCGGGVLTPFRSFHSAGETLAAAQRQAAPQQPNRKWSGLRRQLINQHSTVIKNQVDWIWLVWLDCCEVWDLNLRIYENLRMELLHTYCIIPPILWKEPGNPAASAYSNWPWTSLRPEKAPARFSQRANVANSAETGFNWKLGHAGTDGNHRTLGKLGGKWVGNGCNMLEEVAPVPESGRFVSGWGASFWDKQSLGAFHGTRSSTGTVSRFIAIRLVGLSSFAGSHYGWVL